eukprot:5037169-Pyramimonas_sp.AAC.2
MALVLGTAGCAFFVADLGTLIGLVGAVCSTTLGLILPPVIHYKCAPFGHFGTYFRSPWTALLVTRAPSSGRWGRRAPPRCDRIQIKLSTDPRVGLYSTAMPDGTFPA